MSPARPVETDHSLLANKKRAITLILVLAAILLVTVPAAVIHEDGRQEAAPADAAPIGGSSADPATEPPGTAVTVADRVDNQGNYQPSADDKKYQAREMSTPPPWGGSAAAGSLSAKVTAQKSFDDEAIAIYFYVVGPATYTVQEQVEGSWQERQSGIVYPGSGGLLAATMPAGEEAKTLRLLKVENDGSTAATAAFTVRRSEVEAAGGTKTYSG